MHPKPIDVLNYSSCSLFSAKEYKIESGNLHITDFSFSRNNKEVIPLDLIDPKPRITKKNNEQLIWATVASFAIGLFFILLSLNFSTQIQQILGFVFLAISAIFLISALKLQTTRYTYYYANTSTHLFSITEPQPPSEENRAIKFIQSLNQRINKPNLNLQRKTKKENYNEFLQNLDFLYNFGVITDAQYERVEKKIDVKIYGATNKNSTNSDIGNVTRKSADIIPLRFKNS